MSKTIDEKVVSFQFENNNFQKKAKETLSILEKLKDKLNFKESAKNVREFQDSIDDVDFTEMSNGILNVSKQFNALQTMAEAALTRIATKAVDAGVTLVKSLTIDQVTAGYSKLEQKTASVQTIMNSTGASIEEVNGWLDQLMWFADETSYSFTDMTQSLAQLTSSGGDVEALLPMIMGIANATAYAGKTTAEFSRAIYNLNQAYSTGSLKVIDWRSLENAGVASKALKETLIQAGIDQKKIYKGQVTAASFNNSLANGWVTKAVMEQAFGEFYKYTDMARQLIDEGRAETATEAYKLMLKEDETLADNIYFRAAKAAQEAKTFGEVVDATKDAVSSGWMRTFEQFIGNYDEAKELWSTVAEQFYDIFASGGERRNDLLSAAMDPIDEIGEDIIDKWKEELIKVNDKLKDVYSENGFDADLVKSYFNEEQLEELTDIGVTINDLIDMIANGPQEGRRGGRELLHESITSFLDALVNIKTVFDDVKESVFGSFVSDTLYSAIKGLNSFTTSFKNLTAITSRFNDEGEELTDEGLLDDGKTRAQINNYKMLKNLFSSILGIFKVLASAVRLVAYFFVKLYSSISKLVVRILPYFVGNLEKITRYLDDLIEGVRTWLEENDIIESAVKVLADAISSLYGYLTRLFNKFMELPAVQEAISKIKAKFEEFKENVKNFLLDMQNMDWEEVFLTIAGAIVAGFTSAIEYVTTTDWKKVIGESITTATTTVGDFLGGIKDKAKLSTEQVDKLKEALTWISDYGYAILAGFLAFFGAKKLADIAMALASLPEALAGIVESIGGVFKAISKLIRAKAFEAEMKALLNVALGIALIVTALWVLTKIDSKAMGQALKGLVLIFVVISVLLGVLAGVSSELAKNPKLVATLTALGAVFIALSIATLIISGALFALSKIKNIDKALGTFVLILASLAVFLALINGFGVGSKAGVGILTLIGLAVGIRMLVSVLKMLSEWELDEDSFSRMIENLIICVGVLVGAIWVLSASTLSKTQAFAAFAMVIAISLGLSIIVKTLNKLAAQDSNVLLKGILGLVPIFSALSMLLYTVQDVGTGAKNAGIFIIALSAALFLLSFAIEKLGKMNVGVLIKGGVVASILGVVVTAITALMFHLTKDLEASSFGKVAAIGAFMLALSAVLYILAGVVRILGRTDTNVLIKGVAAVSVLLLALSAPLYALSKINIQPGTLATLITLAVTIGLVLGAFLALVFLADPEKVIIVADSLLKIFAGLTAALVGLAVLAKAAIGITPASVLGMVELIAAIAAIIAAAIGLAGVLSQIEGVHDFINNAGTVLTEIGAAIGGFIGGFLGGIANGAMVSATKDIELVGQRLTNFGNEIKPFLELMQGESISLAVENAKNLFSLMVYLASTNVREAFEGAAAITTTGTMTNLKNFFINYADAIIELSEKFKGTKLATSELTAATNIGKSILDLVNALPYEGGIASWFKGKRSFSIFTENVVDYIDTIFDISNRITYGSQADIDLSKMNNVINIGKTIHDFISKLGEAISSYDVKQGSSVIKQLRELLEICTSFGNLPEDALHPVITPVIDMSSYDAAMAKISSGGSAPLQLNSSYKKATTAASNTTNNTTTNTTKTNNLVQNINMTVNASPGQNAKQVANAVLNEIQKRTNKEILVWGG